MKTYRKELIMNSLKQKLLSTNYFIDNNYLDQYVELVSQPTEKATFKTQSHHILPKTYFKTLSLPIDDSKENLVELLFKDHVKAHYLLKSCTTGFLRRNSGYALRYMLNSSLIKRYSSTLTEDDFATFQQLYEDSFLKIDREIFIDFYSGHSCKETATQFQIGLNTVTKLATEYNCLKLPKRHLAGSRKELDKDALYQYYIIENHTVRETAAHFNVDKSTIMRRLHDCNLAQTKNKYRHAKCNGYAKAPDNIEAFKEYYSTHSIVDTALYFNMSEATVRKFVNQYQINKHKDFDYDKILNHYENFGLTSTLETFGISKTHLYRIKRKFRP